MGAASTLAVWDVGARLFTCLNRKEPALRNGPVSDRSLDDFDRYVEEHRIPAENWPAAFALWIAEVTGGPVPRFEKLSGRRRRTES